MTTTVSFLSRNCVVIGCDSLATTTTSMINPYPIIDKYFDEDNDYKLKEDDEGNPLLKDFDDLNSYIESIPYNQLPSVTKIFNLKPTNMGVLFAGISVINDRSIKNLIDDFLTIEEINDYLKKSSFTVSGVSKRLKNFIGEEYDKEYGNKEFKPELEIIVSGYSKNHNKPEVYKIKFEEDGKKVEEEAGRGEYKIVFGGQHDVIQRVVYGLDFSNFLNFIRRAHKLINDYNEILQEELDEEENDFTIPKVESVIRKLNITSSSWTSGMSSDWSNFSEQASIDFVDFLVDIMIKSQQFSNKLPTVGGKIHLAIITKSEGFKWISKEEYKYNGYGIPKH